MNEYPSSTPEDAYWSCSRFGSRSSARAEQLLQVADAWSTAGNLFAGGIALVEAWHAGCGVLDHETHVGYVGQAISVFRRCVDEMPADSMEGLLALKVWCERLRWLDHADERQLMRATDAVYLTLAERLVKEFGDHPNVVSFRVYGFRLKGPITGPWTAEFPDGVVSSETTTWETHARSFCFRIPSAFELFVRMGDYRAAREISDQFASAFKSPDLRGWKLAVEAFTGATCPAESFAEAAKLFEEAGPEHYRNADGAWSGTNRHLWAPYFRSRSWIARAVADPDRAEELISRAAACVPDQPTYSHAGVRRYHLLIKVLANVLDVEHGPNAEVARREFESEIRYYAEDDADAPILEFLDHAHAGFQKLRMDRANGWGSIGRALHALDRIPLFGKAETAAVNNAVDRRAIRIIDGPNRLWLHQALEGITSEDRFRRLLLRLFQNSVPQYAHIRHGPLEYGKDIAVAAQEGGRLVLRMYQAKCGLIKTSAWNGMRPQLEAIFQIPLDTFQIRDPIDRRVGILIWNGHANPHVEPLMAAWKDDQRTAFDRDFEFMHLDDIVNYILDNRLVSAFREAIAEIDSLGA